MGDSLFAIWENFLIEVFLAPVLSIFVVTILVNFQAVDKWGGGKGALRQADALFISNFR